MNFQLFLLMLACLLSSVLNAQDKENAYSKDSLKVVSLLNLGYKLEAKTPHKAISTYKKAAKISESIHFNLGSFRAYSYTAIVLSDLALYDSAIYYNKIALPFAKKINYEKGIAATYINLGNTYQFFGRYDNVVDNYIKGIQIFKTIADSSSVSQSYQNLAALFSAINRHDKEIEYLELALKNNPKDNKVQKGMIYGDLGLAQTKLQMLPNALAFFNKADSISRIVSNNRLSFFVSRNYGEYHLLTQDYKKAIPFFEQALQINNGINDEYYRAEVLFKLGEAYSNLKRYQASKSYLKKALEFAKKNNIREIQERVYLELAYISKSQGDYKDAYTYKELSSKFSDSLKNERFIKQINVLEAQFKSKKKDNEIYEQRLLLAQQESIINKKQMQNNIAIGLALLFLILSLASWLIYKQRQKRKDQELLVIKNEAQINSLESLIEGEEKERLRIAKELHDGVNGELSAIKHKLNTLLELNNKTIEEAVIMIDKSCEQVRAISHNLVPPVLENFNLKTAIADYCSNMNNIHEPKITFDFLGDTLSLSKLTEVNIFRITQELLTNSIKHAKAKEINVQLSFRNNIIQLAVDDDGVGFNTLNLTSNGLGISNIKSRVAFLNGEIDFVSSESGTSVNILIDITKFNHD
ncbi:tetratricopeptide repeat protein [Algibacter amylolyticus]|uniref:histidine kinase n=1 Tax=Algibacter amylolyticus TaxID=1608400 RepID=A0A5M7BBF2_9FLAO|nr:tetratricopeptide repeat protein [Algibacter amylolyticus]KAA5824515.1 tetratricopeptide repeat protein [Algibacter amylolyticus]MBB5269420.1 signal transduction histidine kinase [Algibacter amylolyticus]TSJ75288.1 tetratricopeptide repeat protein [Algibacter amylolyticus]